MKTIFVTGDRNWSDIERIHSELSRFPSGTRLIHGGARGADSIAHVIGEACGFDIERFDADWTKYGRAAGPMRNRDMMKRLLEIGAENCECFVVHDDLENSKGTKDMKNLLDKNKFTYKHIKHT